MCACVHVCMCACVHACALEIETGYIDRVGGRFERTGVPDRMVCLPGGRVVFVELKAPGEKPTKLQRNRHRELRGFGQIVFGCVDSKADVDLMLRIMNADVTPAETAKAIEELEMRDVE